MVMHDNLKIVRKLLQLLSIGLWKQNKNMKISELVLMVLRIKSCYIFKVPKLKLIKCMFVTQVYIENISVMHRLRFINSLCVIF